MCGRWVGLQAVGESNCLIATGAGPPTTGGHYWADIRQLNLTNPFSVPSLIGLSDSTTAQRHSHRPRAVGAPAQWAGVDFPRVSNLHLHTSV